jgi:MFS family permease
VLPSNCGRQLSPSSGAPPRGSAADLPYEHLTTLPSAQSRPISNDVKTARIVISIQALRALLYGFGAVLLGEVLAAEGLSDALVGVVFTSMLVGMAIGSLAVGRWVDYIGSRRAYCGLFVVLGIAGTAFALSQWLPLLIAAALTGTLSTDANESGPITSLEQAMLSGVDAHSRPRVFGRYNAVAYLAGSIGALAAGGPTALRHVVPALAGDQRWLLAYPVIALACLVLALRLPRDTKRAVRKRQPSGLARSRRNVRRLAGLFAVDAFGGGLVVQSFLVFWFQRRFGTSIEVMGLVFFAVGLLQAASSVAAPLIARRIGLLNTMVFTHLPSNVLLGAVAVMPTLPLAVIALLGRSVLSQMDVPARQAYIAAMVDPEERIAAAAYTNGARYAARPLGPVVAGSLMQKIALSAPFLAAGGIKIAYDVALLFRFRGVAPDDGNRDG